MSKTRPNKKLSEDDKLSVDEYQSTKLKEEREDVLKYLEKSFKPNAKQIKFIDTINNSTITICSGSAGSGKSCTAIYKGLQDIINSTKKLILIRPIFESASQSLGFMPGDFEEKLAPHVKAFMYTLEELIGLNNTKLLINKGKIKFEVLNFLRGSTLSNAVIICDEAQNMTLEEMILAVTRIGKNSKIIFTGDFFQSDLRKAKGSITEFADLISKIKGVNKFTFTSGDVVRNPILVEITKVWEEYKQNKNL